MLGTSQPLIINLAPTGMIPDKATTPHVPVTSDEILEDVAKCASAGASIVHVHARDEDGKPTHRKEYFRPLVEGIRDIDPDLIVCVTCSGRYVSDVEDRSEVLELRGPAKADMASLTLGSNNFVREASVNSPQTIRALAEKMKTLGIKPELEVFEPGMLTMARYLISKGVLQPPCYVNVLFGNLGTAPPTAAMLAAFLSLIPDDWVWAAAGIGGQQLEANVLSMASGGHVRVGIEDNIFYDHERTRLATNVDLVERLVRIADLLGRSVASPREARRLLTLDRD